MLLAEVQPPMSAIGFISKNINLLAQISLELKGINRLWSDIIY